MIMIEMNQRISSVYIAICSVHCVIEALFMIMIRSKALQLDSIYSLYLTGADPRGDQRGKLTRPPSRIISGKSKE